MNKKHVIHRTCLLATGAVFLAFAAGASAAVNMVLTGPPPGPVLDGVYISPYTATVDGVPTTVICDDFSTDISLGHSWIANTTALSSLQGETSPNSLLKFDSDISSPVGDAAQQQRDYTVAAVLATEILDAQQANLVDKQGQLSFALWALFEGQSVKNWLNGYGDSVTYNAVFDATTGYLAKAYSQVDSNALTPSSFPNVTIYSAVPLGYSQEFISVRMLEPSAPSTLALYLIAGLSFALVLRRRKKDAAR